MIESVRTPEPRVQGQKIYPNCDFCVKTSKQGKLRLGIDFSNEFLTRSNVNKQTSLTLVPSSSTLAPDTQSNESHTRSDDLRARSKLATHESHTRVDELQARSRFATHGRDQQRTGNHRHRAQRAPQQGLEEKNSTALRNHVCRVSALCPARNFRPRSNQTMGCATHHAMSGRAYESSLSMSRLVYKLNASASAVAMWMVRHKHKRKNTKNTEKNIFFKR